MRVLIIEDNKHLAESLRVIMGTYFVVEVAYTGEQAMALLAEYDFGLVILDLGLPDAMGIDICKTIRREDKQMPILVVTGEDRAYMMIELLDAGADDYITKPFRTRELKARVRALLRRQETRSPAVTQLVVGDLVLDIPNHCAIRNGTQIYLRSKEFIILEQMMLSPNVVLTRAQLLSKAWDSNEDTWTNTVDVHIKYLRDKIDRPFGTTSIETVHGLGYRLIPTRAKKLYQARLH